MFCSNARMVSSRLTMPRPLLVMANVRPPARCSVLSVRPTIRWPARRLLICWLVWLVMMAGCVTGVLLSCCLVLVVAYSHASVCGHGRGEAEQLGGGCS